MRKKKNELSEDCSLALPVAVEIALEAPSVDAEVAITLDPVIPCPCPSLMLPLSLLLTLWQGS